jgi:hypothetical protein
LTPTAVMQKFDAKEPVNSFEVDRNYYVESAKLD